MFLYILRGVPGSGKSTLAETLAPKDYICEADEYHMVDGIYKFDFKNLGAAHQYCQNKCLQLMSKFATPIVVSNTSTSESEVNTYLEMAKNNGYKTFVLTVENWHNGKNQHNVPQESVSRMKNRLKESIKL